MNKRNPLSLGSAAMLALSLSSTGHASLALEEVIVTAQKKAESLQDTPISLTAFGEDALEKQGIGSLGDIGSKVPALTIEPFPINNATLRIFIRGIGITDAQVTQDPPVGIYVDGAYIARSTGTALDVAELERMEILRGPQGTLYGRNTTGGAINLITKRPNVEEIEFKQKFTAGNRGLMTSKTTLNLPVMDNMAVKLSYLDTEVEGFVENGGPGGDWGDRSVTGMRLDLRWDVSDNFVVDYAYDKSDLDYYNYTYQAISRPTPRGAVTDLVIENVEQNMLRGAGYSSSRLDRLDTVAPLEESHVVISGHSLTLTYDLGDTTQLKYIGAYRELYDSSYADLTSGGAADNSSPFGEFRLDSNEWTSPDGTFYPLVTPVIRQDQVSHEFQLSGDLFDGSVNYILGLYHFEENASEDNRPGHLQLTARANFSGIQLPIANITENFYEVENEATAAFFQATWTPNIWDERLHLTFGARHSQDERTASKFLNDIVLAYGELGVIATSIPGVGGALGGLLSTLPAETVIAIPVTVDAANCATSSLDPRALAGSIICSAITPIVGGIVPADPTRAFTSARSRSFKDDSFAFTVEFDATDDINVYFKIIEAYKAGGFNTRDPHQNGASSGNIYGFGFDDGFNEEKVLSYELGVKTELFDRRMRLNGDVFFSEYSDMQLNFVLDGTVADTKVANAGNAEMFGAEFDLTFVALENLLFMLNYAYLEARVVDATDPATGADITDDYTFGSAPQHSYTAVADWTIYGGDWGYVGLNVSYNYMDDRDGGVRAANKKNLKLNDYYLWNARLSAAEIPVAGGVMSFGLWGKNLLDREYELTNVDNLPSGDRLSIWGEPRTYGLDVSYQF